MRMRKRSRCSLVSEGVGSKLEVRLRKSIPMKMSNEMHF